jgi:hypothetical protein
LAGDSPGYSFPLVGDSLTPAPGSNPSAEYSTVAEAYSYANPRTKDKKGRTKRKTMENPCRF